MEKEKGTHGVKEKLHEALASRGLGAGVYLEVKSFAPHDSSEEDEVQPHLGPEPSRQRPEDKPRTRVCHRSEDYGVRAQGQTGFRSRRSPGVTFGLVV